MATLRNYISNADVSTYTGIAVGAIDAEILAQAEEDIDSYVGPQDRAVPDEYLGRMSAVSGNNFTLESDQQNQFYDDFFKWCAVMIVGGTGIGQVKRITASTFAGVVSVEGWTTTPDTTSVYKIYQLAKFPRRKEEFFDGDHAPNTFYRHIPDMVSRAVAAQYQYRVEMGADFFSGDKANMTSESFGDYSYTKDATTSSLLIAPKAKTYLRGIMNRKGVII